MTHSVPLHCCTVVGARPQFVKAAVVSRVIRNLHPLNSRLQETLIHTGQHFDSNMSDIFFDELDIPKPDFHLGIGGGTHGQNTGRMVEAIEKILIDQKPDWVLVYGDTDSTLAGALAAVKLHIPVAHVEAGLRSFNRRMPEEINRVLTDHASTILFAPTNTAVDNLSQEGIANSLIRQVGDVMYDAALYYSNRAQSSSTILQRLGIAPKEYVLATIHRAENTDYPDRLAEIFSGLGQSFLTVVLPCHPRLKSRLEKHGILVAPNIKLIEPVGYLDMIMLEQSAAKIVTDSGGVQKEAYFFRVPCLTTRDETEWVETVKTGWNVLVGANADRLAKAMNCVVNELNEETALYGDGTAGEAIVKALCEFNFSHNQQPAFA